MAVADWTRTEDWDALYLGGERMPGVARVEVKLPSGIDKQKPKGAKKARLRDIGAPPAEISVELELLPDEMADLEKVMPMLRPKAKDAPHDVLAVKHPNTLLAGVSLVMVTEVSFPQPKSGGSYVLKFGLIESVPKPATVKKPVAKPPEDGWDTKPMTNELNQSPAASGAAEQNFSSADTPLGSGF